MNVILLDNVENLGNIGDLVKVKAGYGRNFLIPHGKAALATPENVKAIDARRAELEKAASEDLAAAQARAKAMTGVELVITANAGSENKLFGSVGPVDIVEALEKTRYNKTAAAKLLGLSFRQLRYRIKKLGID